MDTVLAVLTPDGPRRVDPGAPLLRADDLGVLRGEAVFETVRVAAGRPAFLDLHLARLARSADRLALSLPEGLPRLVAHALDRAGDAVLRLVVTKGTGDRDGVAYALVTGVPDDAVRAREHGVRVVTVTLGVPAGLRAEAPWLLGGVKSTSYAVNMAVQRHAAALGSEDAVLLSSDGEVLEAPTATVAWVSGGRLVTPPADAVGILPGTTMEVVLALAAERGVPCDVRRGTAQELRDADEVVLCSSVRGVAPVVELDGRALPVGPVSALLRQAFEERVLVG